MKAGFLRVFYMKTGKEMENILITAISTIQPEEHDSARIMKCQLRADRVAACSCG